MYALESLKKEFPTLVKDLEQYDKFLRRYYPEEELYKIYDSDKENYHFLQEAYAAKRDGNNALYLKNQCRYGQSMNHDADFLSFYLRNMGNKIESTTTLEEMEQMIKDINDAYLGKV